MNSKYTGKQVEHLLDKISSLSSGDVGDFIGTELLDKFLRKDQDERTPHSLASDKKLEVGNFISGTAGAVIYIDEQTKHSVAEIDKLYVRLKAYFEQLEIINVNSVGGKQIISPAGGIKCSQVETYDSWGYYRCYFLSEQDGEKIENRFAVGDLAYSKTFNAREGSYNKISNRYYYRLVVGRGENYIDLSKTDCDADSDEPQEGDVIVHRGNRNDVDRQNCLEFSSVDSFSPSITLYQGINDYSLADKNVIQFGVEKSTGKAFMNVYGDMFVGNRDNSSYIRYSPEKGVEIKGKLDIGTSFGDKTLQDAIDQASTAYEEDLNNLKDIVNRDIQNIQNQLDGAIETWFYDPAPTLTNLPASQWTTESDKNIHLGDLYYSGAGRAYRFQYDADNSLYYWQEIVDTDIVLALENAKKAQDTADSKRKIFVRKPEASDSYDIGDMWVNATYSDGNVTYTEDLLRAIQSKEIGEQFSITHWTLASKYTDDTVANDALQKATEAQNSVNELQNSVGDFKGYVDGAFLDGIIDTSEAQAIEKYINQLNTIKLQVDKSYEEIIKNSILENTQYLTNLNNSYTAFSSSYTELIDTINSAISDSKTTDLEKAAVDGKYSTFNDKYRDYTAYLNQAINYIEETINGKVERALQDIGGYKYLKAALQENTSIEGGLIQSSMLSLGYTKNNQFLVMAGTNGLVLDKGDRTIASWFGGGMIDMFDYYDSNTKTFNVPEDVRAAAGLDRMDGTGYRAKGNLWWDEAGVVHADPLSFFVGESTVGGLLASFQVVMKDDGKHPQYLIPQVPFQSLEIADYIRIGDALLKYDSASKAIYVTSADGTTNMGFYASGYVSALGKNSSGGSTGSTSALYQLVDVAPNSTNDGVLNATNGSVLMYNGTKWQAGDVVSDISTLTFNVNGSKLFDYNGKSTITANLTVPTKLSQLTDDVVSGKYLPLSGGTITGALVKRHTGQNYITFQDDNGNAYGYLGFNGANTPMYIPKEANRIYTLIHSGNIDNYAVMYVGGTRVDTARHSIGYDNSSQGSQNLPAAGGFISAGQDAYGFQLLGDPRGNNLFFRGIFNNSLSAWKTIAFTYSNVASATKLQTPRAIWGQSFDGTSSINGKLCVGKIENQITINRAELSVISTTDVPCDIILGANNERKWSLTSRDSSESYAFGLYSNTSKSYSLYVTSSGSVGIGTASPGYKLHVNGTIYGNSTAAFASTVTAPTFKGSLDGNASTASKWQTARTLTLTGSVTGNVSFDGSSNISLTTTTNHTHTFDSLTSKPTTLAGYGITDALYKKYITLKYDYQCYVILLCKIGTNSTNIDHTINGTIWNTAPGIERYQCAYINIHCSDWNGGHNEYYLFTPFGMTKNMMQLVTCTYNSSKYLAIKVYNTQACSIYFDGSYVNMLLTPILYYTSNTGVVNNSEIYNSISVITNAVNHIPIMVDTYLSIGHNIGSSTGRAKLSVVSTANNPCDLVLGSNSLYKWSITCRDSSENYMLAFYSSSMHKYACTIDINGNFAATGAVTAKASSSDIRLKTDITDYKALSIIRNHRSIKYHWNEAAKANADIFNDDYWHYGLIAQDVQRDMPQMVSDVFKDYLVINYERLIPICWKGLQEIDDEVTRLKKKVRKLEMEIRELKQERI